MAPANNKACSEHGHSLNVPQGERTGCFHIWLLLIGLNWACLILTHSVPCVSAYKVHLSRLEDAKTEERALKAAALLGFFCGVLFCSVLRTKNWPLYKLGRAWGCSGPQSQSCAAAITEFVGGSGQAPGRSQTAEFPLYLQYLNFLETTITPAPKSSPWSAERILLYCCLSSRTLGAVLFTISGWGWTAS